MGNGPSAEQQIANLCFRYAELVDAGDFDGVSAMFEHATYGMVGRWLRGHEVGDTMRQSVIVYDDGTPKTKHVTTNLLIELGDDGTTATCRSYFAVHQATPALPLQVITTGRYHDRFELAGGAWRFAERTISIDQVGDMTHHLVRPPKADRPA